MITELPQIGTMFLSVSTFPANRLISFDPLTATALVQIVQGDISTQTLVTFVNSPIPEPGTAWLVGSGLAFWALRRSLAKHPAGSAPRKAASSIVRRSLHSG